MRPPQHPLEHVYAARDALDAAYTAQAQAELADEDLPSYGTALLAALNGLAELTKVLARQVDQLDRDRLYRRALRDHPYEVIDNAVEHLVQLQQVLNTAVNEASRYRNDADHVDKNVDSRDER